MKKYISLLLSALMMISLAGCDIIGGEDVIVDWVPVNLFLKVTDSHGTDLLDPENPKNMIDGTTITFKGKTYEATRERDDSSMPKTRAYLARIYGFCLTKNSWVHNTNIEGNSLVFGEIDGAADMDEDLVVTLPDGTTATISYHCSNHNERKISCNRSWKFNGVKTKQNIFTIVVPN